MTDRSTRPDVLVIGGGIAGSGLASVLAREGLAVTVVERAPRFIDRVRGEFVHVWGVREMERVGLLEVTLDRAAGRILPWWTRYVDGERQEPYRWSEDDFPDVPGTLSVSHPALQQALIEHAAEQGATVLRPAALADLLWDGEQPVARIRTGDELRELRPRLVVGADGSHSLVRRKLGGTGITDEPHHFVGSTLVRGLDVELDSAHLFVFEGGISMVFPQRDDISRVYHVCAPEEAAVLQRAEQPAALLDRLREVLPAEATRRLAGTEAPVGVFPNAETLATVTHGPGAVLIGDAAGSNDPSQGHGLSLVFRDIRDLSERLRDEEDWSDVPAAFAADRAWDHDVLRAHAQWVAPLSAETGPGIDALRERVDRAREIDPTAGGFAGIYGTGPAGLEATEAARRHFLGEDLDA